MPDMTDPRVNMTTASQSGRLKSLSIASTLSIAWGAILFLSAAAIGLPALLKGNIAGIMATIVMFLLPSILLLVGGFALRKLKQWAAWLVFCVSALLLALSVKQLQQGIHIALLGIIINAEIVFLVAKNGILSKQREKEDGV